MKDQTINEQLMHAIAFYDVKAVQNCLEKGADANFFQPSEYERPELQPTTPLRLVMFRISDSMLDDEALKKFAEIAKLLLKHGADPKPAMEIAELRYGKYDVNAEPGPFMDVWHIVANAK